MLINLREETLDGVLVNQFAPKRLYNGLNLSTKCYPFENNPFISNLAGSKSIENGNIKNIVRTAGYDKVDIMRPYLILKSHIKQSGEIYFDESLGAVVCLPNGIVLAFFRITVFRTNMAADLVRLIGKRIITVCIIPPAADQEVFPAVLAAVREVV